MCAIHGIQSKSSRMDRQHNQENHSKNPYDGMQN